MQAFGKLLIWLGIVVLVGGLSWGGSDARRVISMRSRIAKLNVRIDTTRASLFYENTQYRGFRAGVKTMPDSIRKAESFTLQRRGDDHRKRVLVLERADEEFNRRKRRRYRQIDEVKTHFVSHGLPVAGGGLLLLLIGVVLRRTSLSR